MAVFLQIAVSLFPRMRVSLYFSGLYVHKNQSIEVQHESGLSEQSATGSTCMHVSHL